MSEHGRGTDESDGTPHPTRGSGEPAPGAEPAASREGVDEELLADGAGVPRLDALDPGDPGAPAEGVGTGTGDGTGPGGRHEGGAGGSGARIADMRDRGSERAGDNAPRSDGAT